MAQGEAGLETDTNLLKFGDGVTNWNSLAYFGPATTEYTEGDVDATISGPAILWEDAGDTLRTVSAATPLPVNVVSGGGTVVGTVTANAGTNLNTSALALEATLQSVKTAVELLDNSISGAETQVDVITVPAPLNLVGGGVEAAALRVTIATDSTGVLSVDDNGSTLSIDDGGGSITIDGTITVTGGATETTLGSVLTSVQLLDDVVVTLGTTAYTEATTKGNVIAAVRRDADTTLVDTTNELGPLQMDALGRLKVEVFSGETLPVSLTSTTITGTVAVTQSGVWDEVGINDSGNSITVDNAGVFAVQDSEKLADNAGFTDGTTKLQPIGFIYDEVAGTALTENDIAAARIDVKRATVGVIEDGVTRGRYANVLDLTNSNPVTTAIVDANGDQITTFGGGTQYTEDAVAAVNPIGNAQILVRADTPAALVTTDGDNVAQRGTNYGAAYTQIVSSAGAFIDTFGGGTQYTEDVAAAGDPVGTQLIARRRDSLATETTTDGDNTAVNTTGKGELYVKHVDIIPVTDNSGSLTVDAPVGTPVFVRLSDGAAAITTLPVSLASVPSHAVTNAGVFAVQVDGSALTALQLMDDVVATLGTTTYTEATSKGNVIAAVRRDADTPLADTTNEFTPLITDANGYLKVEIFDGGGTHTVDAPVATPVNVQIGNGTLVAGIIDETGASAVDALAVGGGTAHDAVDSGNPVKVGFKALSALPTVVATADRANGISDLWGRQLVSHIDPIMQITKSFNATSTQTGTDVWDPAVSSKIAITSIVIGTYGTTAGRLILWFGDNADTTYTAGTDQLVLAASFAPSATIKPGLVFTPATPIFCTTADRELHVTTDAALSVDIAVAGYEFL